jgi:hypothetical protein
MLQAPCNTKIDVSTLLLANLRGCYEFHENNRSYLQHVTTAPIR